MKKTKLLISALILTLIFTTGIMTGCGSSDAEQDSDKPVIGVTWMEDIESGEYSEDLQAYINAVENAGAEAVALPLYKDDEEAVAALEELDGIVFTGGEDIDPAYYGEEVLPECEEINKDRDVSDVALMKAAIEADVPVLGTCRGMQLLNVVQGGTLYQDLPTQLGTEVGHREDAQEEFVWHDVTIEEDSILYEAMGETTLNFNSWHHQGIKDLGEGLEVKATSADGLVECVELTDNTFVLGVQCHPEWHVDEYYGDEEYIAIFEALVDAAAAYSAK